MRILLQTTIPSTADDWSIARFSMLHRLLAESGHEVTSRNNDDRSLAAIDRSPFDQVWLFGVDAGDGIGEEECAALTRFGRSGRGLLVTRDHQDLGSSICDIGGVGAAHHFHSRNTDPDPSRQARDDRQAGDIDWPNYHSGQNGEYQRIRVAGDVHPLLQRPDGTPVEWFPAHPHEGSVGPVRNGRVIATGTSATTSRAFNLLVALEADGANGRAIAESSFHHLCDYNWDPRAGAPSFVADPPADEVIRDPQRLEDVKTYVRNAARWLGR
ncbi:MAG TPA: hypothetical protein VGR02_21575 [Thermoanaerobaculia bacterium]|jgi:hypothetical protein|nr:hypothetical protein [Thermoanaerobaculia bacterium]